MQDTKFCENVWKAWTSERAKTTQQTTPALEQMNNTQLNIWLSSFALEVCKQNGLEYPPNILHHIFAGLQRYLCGHGRHVDLFSGTEFAPFQATLDGEMKRLQSLQIGSLKRQAGSSGKKKRTSFGRRASWVTSIPNNSSTLLCFTVGSTLPYGVARSTVNCIALLAGYSW